MDNIIPLFSGSGHKISLFRPKSFADVQVAVDQMKSGQLIMFNIAELPAPLAQRLTDFAAGSVSMLGGQTVDVGNGVFLYGSSKVAIAAYERQVA
ncbi:MAG: cell division protein SepF [Acaryochloridaceae cyanobacterium SU_2_1]|nr:cell division protein SepF [Acaryochloridaceae cyanobacterium SU_2_1]